MASAFRLACLLWLPPSGSLVSCSFRLQAESRSSLYFTETVRNTLIFIGAIGLLLGFAMVYPAMRSRSTSNAAVPVSVPAARVRAADPAAVIESAVPPPAPDTSRSAQLFDRNRGMASDPDLAAEYDDLNVRYFRSVMPAPHVRWEDGLGDLGPLIADNFSVLGLTDGEQILINPISRRDPDTRRRALVHEMVHVAVWKMDDAHGAVFQEQLRQLAQMGAFKGIVATDAEKDAALAAIHEKRANLETEERSLEAARASLDQTSQPAVDAFNARVERQKAGAAEYNHLVEQYNLMIAYPDGLARDRLALRADGTAR